MDAFPIKTLVSGFFPKKKKGRFDNKGSSVPGGSDKVGWHSGCPLARQHGCASPAPSRLWLARVTHLGSGRF